MYRRDKSVQTTPEEDQVAVKKFYENNGVKHYDLPLSGHALIFKRTLNFVYIVEHIFSKEPNVHTVAKLGKDEGYGIIRTKAFVFYRGIILYTLDHDYRSYPCLSTGLTTTKHKKCIKLNYETHEELNNIHLKAMGRVCESFPKFNGYCHDLLINDNESQSINFIKESDNG